MATLVYRAHDRQSNELGELANSTLEAYNTLRIAKSLIHYEPGWSSRPILPLHI